MAGGALGGVFGAALRLFPWYREDLDQDAVLRQRSRLADRVAALFFALCVYLWVDSVRGSQIRRERLKRSIAKTSRIALMHDQGDDLRRENLHAGCFRCPSTFLPASAIDRA